MLRGKNAAYWADTLARLRKADLSAVEKQLPPGQQSFFKVVETSFQSLESALQDQYKALAILLEDMAAPLPILEALWNVETADARLISNRLVELSLAQTDNNGESIRLHDLQLDYVRAQFMDQVALSLIRSAVRLSSHVIERDPTQFTSQMIGRLLPFSDQPGTQLFIDSLAQTADRIWLRPIWVALDPPSTVLLRNLIGHSDIVYGVAIAAGGRHAVSASFDRTLKVRIRLSSLVIVCS